MTSSYRLAALAVSFALLTGCGSLDKYEYVSTPHLPTTVSLMNTATDQVFWKMDIPVGCKLKMDFDRPGDFDFLKVGKTPADTFKWKIEPVAGGESRSGTETLDGLPFVVKVNYRTPGELPVAMGDVPPATMVEQTPVAPPAQANVVQYQPAAVSSPAPPPAPQPMETVSTYQSPSPAPAEPITITVTPQPAVNPVPVASYTAETTPPASSGVQWEQPVQVSEPATTTTAAMPVVVTPEPVSTPAPVIEAPSAAVNNQWITTIDETPAVETPAPQTTEAVAEAPAEKPAEPEKIDLDALFGTPEPAPAAKPAETQAVQLQPIRSTVTVTPAPQPSPVSLPPMDNIYQSPPQPEVNVPTPTVEKPVIKVESSERIAAPDVVPTFESKPLVQPPSLRFDVPAHDNGEPQLTPQGAAPAAPGSTPAAPLSDAGDADGYRRVPVKIESQLLNQFDAKNVSILIEGVPRDASLSTGRNNGSGIWTLRGDQITGLHLKAPARFNEDVQLLVIATAPTTTGDTASSIANMTVRMATDAPIATVPVEASNAWH